jgi:hypothetical protein
MSAKQSLKLASILLVLFLAACSTSEENIVGRWEFGDQEFGRAYEFYEDGSGFIANSVDPYTPQVGVLKYTYDPKSGVLKIVDYAGPSERTFLNMVSFTSKDEISIEQSGMSKPWVFVRKPIPELPAGARARIGVLMLGKKFELIEAKKLEPGWADEMKDYIAVAKTDIEIIPGQRAEEWLVKLQVEGEDQETQYVLREGPERWGVLELVKQE